MPCVSGAVDDMVNNLGFQRPRDSGASQGQHLPKNYGKGQVAYESLQIRIKLDK